MNDSTTETTAPAKTAKIILDDVEYELNNFSNEQKAMVNHLADLENKIANSRFQLDQLLICRDAFMNMLKKSLAEKSTDQPAVP